MGTEWVFAKQGFMLESLGPSGEHLLCEMLIRRVKNARGQQVLGLGICELTWSQGAGVGKIRACSSSKQKETICKDICIYRYIPHCKNVMTISANGKLHHEMAELPEICQSGSHWNVSVPQERNAHPSGEKRTW